MYSPSARDSVAKRPPYFHTASLGLLIFLPAGVFLVISLSVATLLHQARAVCWALLTVCVGACLLLMAVRSRRDGPNYWCNLGFLCLVATLTASTAGIWNFERTFGVFWASEGQRDYSNVLPGEPALSHLDAGRIRFGPDARLDFANSARYKDGRRTYCVVPIVQGARPAPAVQFWAAGVDCCGGSGNFSCGDASDRGARSGLVYLEPADRLWFGEGPLESFRLAATESAKMRGAASSPDALFVRWLAEPDAAQLAFWRAGVGFLVSSSAVYLAVSVVVGATLHFGRGPAWRSGVRLESRSL